MKSTFRSTIDDIKKQVKESGGSLTKLPTEFHAQSLHDWLKEKLPKHLEVWIIEAPGRSNEVNVYTIGSPDRERVNVRSNSRSSKASRVPERFKQWKRDKFPLREDL